MWPPVVLQHLERMTMGAGTRFEMTHEVTDELVMKVGSGMVVFFGRLEVYSNAE